MPSVVKKVPSLPSVVKKAPVELSGYKIPKVKPVSSACLVPREVKAGCWYKVDWLPNLRYKNPLEYNVEVTETKNEGFIANWYCPNNRKNSTKNTYLEYNKMQNYKILKQLDKAPEFI